MNQTLKTEFGKLISKYQQEYDETKQSNTRFKINSSKKTLRLLNTLDFEITNGNQLSDYNGIGKKTIDKINEILTEGKLSSVSSINTQNETNHTTKLNSNMNNIKHLTRITGIGPVKAKTLLSSKITLETLKTLLKQNNIDKLKELLTHHQLIGLIYLKDIETRIPYSRIQEIEIYLSQIIKSIDEKLNMTICGSYRRKKPDSGDIDILIHHKTKNSPEFLKKFIVHLKKQQFLIDDLTKEGSTKYMGICKYKNSPAMRIDIRYIKKSQVPSSILYFTGSGEFNKNMRTYAIKNGYKLNEYGLFRIYKINNSQESKETKIQTKTEKDIFTRLSLNYIEPENRTEFVKFF
jgi:DNA polymerase/3'-5' exonuclease PolX